MVVRVLILGFSVLSNHVFSTFSKKSTQDLNVEVFSLGGHHYNYITPIIEYVVEQKKPDLVLFDLASTPCRKWTEPGVLTDHLNIQIQKSFKFGAQVAFLNLYRSDVDPTTDPICKTIHQVAERLGLPILDLATEIHLLPNERSTSLFPDGVHANEAGAEYIVRRTMDFVMGLSFRSEPGNPEGTGQISERLQRMAAIPATEIAAANPRQEHFARYGVEFPVLCIDEGTTVSLDVPKGYAITGMYFVFGPRSGEVEIRDESGHIEMHICSDRWSYYDHAMHRATRIPTNAEKIFITQLAGLPDITLLKGERSPEKRKGLVGLVTLMRK